MVKKRNKDSRKSFGSKRFNEDFPGARKINASTAYGTCSEQLSPFAGFWDWSSFWICLILRSILKKAIFHRRGKPSWATMRWLWGL